MLALRYIHSLNILHRDLKTSNIFLQENGDLKIGDFGIARVLEGTMANAESVVGTPYYMSPEICQNKPYSFKSDVWSLGCILFELCTLEHAFKSNNLLNLVFKIAHEDPDPIPEIYSSDLQELISLLLRKNIDQRPTLDQLIQVDFVRWFLVGFMNHDGFEAENSCNNLNGTFQVPSFQAQHQNVWTSDIDRRYSDSAHSQTKLDQNRPRVSSFEQMALASNYPNSTGSNTRPADLTPMEKLKLRKEIEAKKREQEMKYAILKDVKKIQNNKIENNSGTFDQKIPVNPSLRRHESEKNPEIIKQTAFNSNGRNVMANLDSDGLKNNRQPPLCKSNSDVRNYSKDSFADTFKQNLEETIQSQYFPEIKASFNKSKSLAKSFAKNEVKEDFPPDFDDFEDTLNNAVVENEFDIKNDRFTKKQNDMQNSGRNNPKISQFKQKIITKIGEPLFYKIYEFVSLNKRNGIGNKNVNLKDAKKCRR